MATTATPTLIRHPRVEATADGVTIQSVDGTDVVLAATPDDLDRLLAGLADALGRELR